MNITHNLSSLFERFLSFEEAHLPFSWEIAGVRFWHYVRFGVFSAEIQPAFLNTGAAHPDIRIKPQKPTNPLWRILEYIRRNGQRLGRMMFFNPSFSLCHKDVLFSLAPRITTTTDGRRLRLALDFFADKMKSSWATLEHPIPGSGGYTANDGGGRTFCWTTAQYEVRKYMKSRDFTTLSPMMEAAAMRLTNELYDCLGVHIEA